jgi:hypothetical protein
MEDLVLEPRKVHPLLNLDKEVGFLWAFLDWVEIFGDGWFFGFFRRF